jgi:hypothetical protein
MPALKRTFALVHTGARHSALDAVRQAPQGWMVQVGEPTRTLEQNAAQWPYLQALAKHATWPVNGVYTTMTEDEWKDVLTAAFHRESVRLAAAFDGGRPSNLGDGVVMLGMRTSTMGKREFSEWLEFLKYAVANLLPRHALEHDR